MQTRIYNLLSTSIRNVFSRNIHTGRCLFQTHYDVLKLPRSCTAQEIRSSFIKLSKEAYLQYHPDKNTKDDNRHALFVRLNEAYSVLSRPESRKEYDLSLIPHRTTANFSTETYTAHRVRPFKDPSFWENRDKSNTNYDRPYYGIKGVNKMSNTWIVIFCFIFTAIGVGLQVLLIKRSVSFSRKSLDEQSQQNALTYAMVREKAIREGDADVFRRMELNADKFMNRQQAVAKKEN